VRAVPRPVTAVTARDRAVTARDSLPHGGAQRACARMRLVRQLHMYRTNPTTGQFELDLANQKLADKKGVGFKNARGDRPTIVVTPHDGPYAEQALGMTRSLGDFYLHACGVTWVPEVSVVDLEQVVEALRAPVLFLASDGFWDLWSYQEVRARARPIAAMQAGGASPARGATAVYHAVHSAVL